MYYFLSKMRKKFIYIASVALGFAPLLALAQTTITVNPVIPGTNPLSNGTGGIVANFYSFALLISGILAFGAIVYGGIKYATGRGNPSAESDGKSWITNALLGLLLIGGAYVVLYTINPNLVNLNLPVLGVPQSTGTGGGGTGGGGGGNPATGCSGGTCQDLGSDGFTCKSASQQPGGVYSCSAAQGMVDTLDCMQQNGAPPYTVTEAMPPTVDHSSKCHNDGCCVDVVANSGSCADVQALVNAAKACGTSAANEYANCGGTIYNTTDGNNVHINSAPGGGC
jgi:hypothetical protein